ncbi:DUF6207 family protein [Streptomyces sp. NPDC003719]
MEAINDVHVSEPGLVVVDVAAAQARCASSIPWRRPEPRDGGKAARGELTRRSTRQLPR